MSSKKTETERRKDNRSFAIFPNEEMKSSRMTEDKRTGCFDRACNSRVKMRNYRDISERKKMGEKNKKLVSETFTFSRRLRKSEVKPEIRKGLVIFFQNVETKYMQWIILHTYLYARNKRSF